MPQTVYRIVLSNSASLEDFLSNAARGRPPRNNNPEVLRLWNGLSVYATLGQARRKARGAPYLGGYVAELRIPTDAPAQLERTRGPGHHTLWAEPALALSWVVAVVPVHPGAVDYLRDLRALGPDDA